jgi:hypothetical protein
MLTPATFACRAAPDDRDVSTLRIFLERVAPRTLQASADEVIE